MSMRSRAFTLAAVTLLSTGSFAREAQAYFLVRADGVVTDEWENTFQCVTAYERGCRTPAPAGTFQGSAQLNNGKFRHFQTIKYDALRTSCNGGCCPGLLTVQNWTCDQLCKDRYGLTATGTVTTVTDHCAPGVDSAACACTHGTRP